MSTCSGAHVESTEAPVSLPEASVAHMPVTTVFAGKRFRLASIVYIDRTLLTGTFKCLATTTHILIYHCILPYFAPSFIYVPTIGFHQERSDN